MVQRRLFICCDQLESSGCLCIGISRAISSRIGSDLRGREYFDLLVTSKKQTTNSLGGGGTCQSHQVVVFEDVSSRQGQRGAASHLDKATLGRMASCTQGVSILCSFI